MCQSCHIGPNSMYCDRWRKISKSHCDLDFDRTMPNDKLAWAVSYTTKVSSGLNHYFLSYCSYNRRYCLTLLYMKCNIPF